MTVPACLPEAAYSCAQLYSEEVMNKQVPSVGGCQELLWQDSYRGGNWKKLLQDQRHRSRI